MITLHWLYALAGAMFAAFAVLSALDRANKKRLGNAAFWGLMALSLLAGDAIGDFGNGLLVLGLAGLAGFGLIGRSSPQTTADAERQGWSDTLGNRLFLPALIIPATALIGTLAWNYAPLSASGLIEAKRETYVFLGLGVSFALAAIFAWLRPPAVAPLQEGRRLIDAIGWAAVLPQMLASLGVLFAAAGVAERRVIVGEGADQRGQRDDQRRQEQPVAELLRPGLALLVAGRRRVASPDEAEPGETGEAEHQQAVAEIADDVSAEQAQRHQPPERRIAEPLGMGAIERRQQGERREHRPGERVKPVQRDHGRRLARRRSSISKRVPWIRKANTAVGIAHSASSSGARL